MADIRPKRDWRSPATTPPGANAPSKAPLFLMGLLAATLIGALAGLAYWIFGGHTGPVRFITMPLCEYDEPWPTVPFAEADADRLFARFPAASAEKAYSNQEQERFTATLKSLERHSGQPLVVHLSGLAVVHHGKIYILSSRAQPGEPDSNWHSLDELLDAMTRCEVKDKLLILDLGHAVADAKCGVLADVVSTALWTKLHEYVAAKPNIGLVLVSCGRDEFSVSLEEEGATVFGYYLDEGLKGAADNPPFGNGNNWVSVQELATYVADRVNRWTLFARSTTQKPYLLGKGDFRLTGQSQAYDPEVTEMAARVYPEWLFKGWELRDLWKDQGAWRRAPQLIRELETALLRAEERFRLRGPDPGLEKKWSAERDKLAQLWNRIQAVPPPPKISVVGAKPNDALETKLAEWIRSPEPRKKLPEALGEPKQKAEDLLFALWRKLAIGPQSREMVFLLADAAPLPELSLQQFAEAVFFFKLKKLADSRSFKIDRRTWPAEAVHAAVLAEQTWFETLEQLLLCPEGFGWFRPRLDALHKRKTELERTLWILGDDTFTRNVNAQLRDDYQQLSKDLEVLRADAEKTAKAIEALAIARAELSGYARWLTRLDSTERENAPKSWNDAAEAAAIIADDFDADKQSPYPGDRLMAQTAQLTRTLTALRNQSKAQTAREPSGRLTPPILAMPCLIAKDRKDYWAKWHAWALSKHKPLKNPSDDEVNRVIAAAPSASPPAIDRPALRAQIAIALGRLGGHPVEAFKTEWNQLKESNDPSIWDDFGLKLLPLFVEPTAAGDARKARFGTVFSTKSAVPATAAAQMRAEQWRQIAQYYDEGAQLRGLDRESYYTEAIRKTRASADAAIAAARE